MKRSRMVEILEQEINSRTYLDYQYSTEEVSDILKALEEAGMLPPPTYLEGVAKVEGNKVDLVWEKE